MAELEFERDSTAVVIMDYQKRYSKQLLHGWRGPSAESGFRTGEARDRPEYRSSTWWCSSGRDYPEVLPRNRQRFGTRLIEGTPGADVHPAVAPQPGEAVVVKRRTGPFSTTDLDAVLHSIGATTLVLFGVATSGCVLTAVRWAADVDYRLVVVADCCGDQDPKRFTACSRKRYSLARRMW